MPRTKPVTWNGITYPSAKDCAEAINVNTSTLRSWLRNGRTGDADRKPKRKRTTFNFMGYPYKNETELRALMRKHMGLSGKPKREKPKRKKSRKPRMNVKGEPCEWNGVQYNSIADCARSLGQPYGTVFERIKKGWTCDADVGVKVPIWYRERE